MISECKKNNNSIQHTQLSVYLRRHGVSKHHTQLAKMSFKDEFRSKTFLVDLTAEVYFFIFVKIHTDTKEHHNQRRQTGGG